MTQRGQPTCPLLATPSACRTILATTIAAAIVAGSLGCQREGPIAPGGGDARPPDASGLELIGAPLVFAPTPEGFGVNVVLRSGDPSTLRLWVREEGALQWSDIGPPSHRTEDVAQWSVQGLEAGRRHEYRIAAPGLSLYSGTAMTARPPGTPFRFALITDTHVVPRDPVPAPTFVGTDFGGVQESTLLSVTSEVRAGQPDFLLNLGDTLDFHAFGFNEPPPDGVYTKLGYLNYRRLLGDTLGHVAHFPVIGNWDGESGCNTDEEIQRSLAQRLVYVPGPGRDTYPEGGSANGDYYAFTWGDALFVVLNVMTYTPTCHLLGTFPGLPDDWTLGDDQLAWLERTLAAATARWRFLFIHHTVGGAAGDFNNSAYGRGGGQAARVGEQAVVHDLMMRHGAQIFFYAHDHVFTDMVVDGIHYTLPGSAGAPWKFNQLETGYSQYWPDSGHARVDVSAARVKVDLVALGGAVLTSYSIE